VTFPILRRIQTWNYRTVVIGATLSLMIGAGTAAASQTRIAMAFGVHLPGAPEQGTTSLMQLERTLQRRIEIVNWYQQWGGAESAASIPWLNAVAASGRIPLLTWEPWVPPTGSVPIPGQTSDQPAFGLREIAAGKYDAYVKNFAHALAAWGRPVYLRPMHEMNGTWYPWGGTVNGNSPLEFRLAWKHLHDIFVRNGATNVRWVFCVNAEDVPASNGFERYYPGAAYVNVFAIDGYNWGSKVPQYGGWRTFDQIFHGAYIRLSKLGDQPIWITEVASADEGGSKAAWVRDMFGVTSTARYARLRALVWFDVDKERDWRATSSASSAAAFASNA
jgi:Glycosyl hydrolase family 26